MVGVVAAVALLMVYSVYVFAAAERHGPKQCMCKWRVLSLAQGCIMVRSAAGLGLAGLHASRN